jgi:hypothetical protein
MIKIHVSDPPVETTIRAELGETEPPRRGRWVTWAKWIVLVAVSLWLAGVGISLLIQYTHLHQKFTARLEAAFGRPVEVRRYDFSFLDGPVLDAHSVTVAEDPRFGHEYFLRAESMEVRLRWRSLLRGHIELGTLSLEHPSLNIVRSAGGDWNLADWLPRPVGPMHGAAPGAPQPPARGALRFQKIEVAGGRIDFKRGVDKLPVGFVDVNGTVETDGPGRWRINLASTPWRAATIVQQSGTIQISGEVGGTSSRLRPAALDLFWRDAYISDLLRLTLGDDYGLRGTVAISLHASTESGDSLGRWALHGRAELGQIHRWDLAARSDNPSFNVIVDRMVLDPQAPSLAIEDATIEAAHSSARATGLFSWAAGGSSLGQAARTPSRLLDFGPSRIDLRDLVAAIRAFRPGLAAGVSLRGDVNAQARFVDWPLQLVSATATSGGADLTSTYSRELTHVGPIQIGYDRGQISLIPVSISWNSPGAPPVGSFRLEASAKAAHRPLAWHVAGSTRQAHELIAAAEALGLNLSPGWDLRGPVSCDLRWQDLIDPRNRLPIGWIELGETGTRDIGASLSAPFLNQPVTQIRARVELQPNATRISLASAQAFGTHWTATLDRRPEDLGWQFTLAGDHLTAGDLDRWLNPRWREGLLDRMLPFLKPRLSENMVPENFRASGSVAIDQFTLEPLTVRRLRANLKIEGRQLELSGATGQFYGGVLSGSLRSDLAAVPVYQATLGFSHVDLSALLAGSQRLAGDFSGSASGQISIDAQGFTRADLIASLDCDGVAHVDNPGLRTVNLPASLREGTRRVGISTFRQAAATFKCSSDKVQFQDFRLSNPAEGIEGSGTVDFSRNIDFGLRTIADPPEDADPSAPAHGSTPAYHVSGPLAAPQIARIASADGRRQNSRR